jgi:hypothetical protein
MSYTNLHIAYDKPRNINLRGKLDPNCIISPRFQDWVTSLFYLNMHYDKDNTAENTISMQCKSVG